MTQTVLSSAPKTDDRISFVIGDDVEVRRIITRLPAGQTVVQAWLTIKDDVDALDTAAIIQKSITIANVVGTGQIEDDGEESGKASLRFDFTPSDTLLFAFGGAYFFDVQIKTSTDKVVTPLLGMLLAKSQVTRTS